MVGAVANFPQSTQPVLIMYDGVPYGWSAITRDSRDTNSIWIVKLAWNRH
jgi:hypothetical protein